MLDAFGGNIRGPLSVFFTSVPLWHLAPQTDLCIIFIMFVVKDKCIDIDIDIDIFDLFCPGGTSTVHVYRIPIPRTGDCDSGRSLIEIIHESMRNDRPDVFF